MKLRDIARLVEGEIIGDEFFEIERLSKIEEAQKGDITFLANPKYLKFVETTGASALLVSKSTMGSINIAGRKAPLTLIAVADSYRSFLQLIEVFYPQARALKKEIHPTAILPDSVKVGSDIAIGARVVVGEGCVFGNGVTVHPGTVIHDDVFIGDDSIIYSNVTIREQCRIGKRAIVHSGTVIGSDGFGFAPKPDGSYEKIPQRGIVVIEDDVEIGSNCSIDRATIGETRIKRGVKLDNLIQVAHNVVIGKNTVIAAQSGISGSSKIGEHCAFGGQVGIAGHLEIPPHTNIAAQSGVARTITKPGRTWFGSPIREVPGAYRIEAGILQLPELIAEVRSLRAKLEQLELEIKNNTTAKT
ncbi:MAG: UDP-3-O-(3-hydroxymyristoyl)glucosamine N-acyltransferase [Bacteroidota bacterium]